MTILGIDAVIYRVEDVAQGCRFFDDWGLARQADNTGGRVYETSSGSQVILRPGSSEDDAVEGVDPGCAVREVVWGVMSGAGLETIARALGRDREVRVDPNGNLHSVDDSGIGIGFRPARHRTPQVARSPINAVGRRERIDRAGPSYDRARPLRIGHVVFAVPDIEEAEAFYTERLGFRVSDRYVGRGVFMRCGSEGDHHNLLFLKAADGTARIAHLAFEVRDIHEVFGGGMYLGERGWKTAIGPGRHKVSSAYFWYFDNPCGGEVEYFTDMDYVTDAWEASAIPASPDAMAEWTMIDGIERFAGFGAPG